MPHPHSNPPRASPPALDESPTEALGYRAGQVIAGKYELVRLLGSGGMGAVWAVRNLIIDAEFALKMVRNDGGDASSAERMLREARSAARIEHPAIVRVFDFGATERGDSFLVMDLLAGVTVREVLQNEGPMSAIQAAQLLLPIADALSVAHSRDVIHRDVKTDNIMIVPDGHGRVLPTLVDFGIAKQLRTDEERLTMNGTVIGSPEYMSPEQARGLGDVDQTTDIWSLSVVLFEMISGHTPFHREDGVASVLHAITDEAATPLAVHGIHEEALQALLDRGLAKFRNARFEDMRAFGTSLARFLLSKGIEEDASGQSIRAVWFDSHASAPPVAIDAGRKPERLPRIEPMDGYTRPTRGAGWSTAIVVSVLAIAVALGVGVYARQLFRPMQASGVVEPQRDLPVAESPPRSDFILAAPVVTPTPPPPAESAPVTSAATAPPPLSSAESAVAREGSSPPPATKPAAPSRPVEAMPHPSHIELAPPGVDVADLPSVFVPSPAEPPVAPPVAPPVDSNAPREETPSQDRHDPPKPSDLRNPYPSPDDPY
ncbi:MAG TPA: serine/threonine-protein kinase [Polyangiaceae bacterium]